MSLQNSHQIENVKMMLVKGIDGKGITTIEKTSTSGLVDTYTITYTDGTKDTFTVTNGKSISSIEKTGTSGLVDTYTITFNDGTTGTFTVTNGKSIVSIEKTGTVGLTDTYTITYNDGSTDTFEVVNGGYDVGDQNTAVGNPLSFTTDSAQVSQGTVITLEPIQSGSGDPSPSNERAISGYDEIDLGVPRVNQWDEKWEVGALNNIGQKVSGANRTRTKNYIPCIPGRNYYFKGPDGISIYVCYYDANKHFVSASTNSFNAVYETPLNCYFMMFNTGTDYGGTYNNDISINYPSTDTTYEPYNPITDISIQLDSTIYGGMLDVESGELVVDRGIVDLGDLTWTYNAGGKSEFASPLPLAKFASATFSNPNGVCSIYPVLSGTYSSATTVDKTLRYADKGYNTTIPYITIFNSTYNNASTFKTAMAGQKLIYELATPLTYHLTPHQVKLLQGANVVTSNGTSISLKWREGQVMTLDDANGLAESIEALGEQGTKVKTFTPEVSATMWSDVIDFFLSLPPEKQLTAKIFVNYKWYSPAYVSGDDTYFVSGDITAKIVSSTPTIVYARASKSGITMYSFACNTGTVTESSQYGVPTLYYLD